MPCQTWHPKANSHYTPQPQSNRCAFSRCHNCLSNAMKLAACSTPVDGQQLTTCRIRIRLLRCLTNRSNLTCAKIEKYKRNQLQRYTLTSLGPRHNTATQEISSTIWRVRLLDTSPTGYIAYKTFCLRDTSPTGLFAYYLYISPTRWSAKVNVHVRYIISTLRYFLTSLWYLTPSITS